ncbi:3'-5' exonuclease [Methanofollis tationis]|uniref:3'-5' exonuclease n=1 Tax=Methanofollis tationis TaxID=81417 RepID=A0A7K4HS85_9EURY|nr:3'-5' exonuclease [Methanofollis tationis]NVO67730.1 3'-5' exonuclease [Methanofollis tationis]
MLYPVGGGDPPEMSATPLLDGTVLVIDTETTGRFVSGRPPPRLVEVAWVLCDGCGSLLAECAMVVVPAGFCIPRSAVEVHGITTMEARREGVALLDALAALAHAAARADLVVAHNLAYDRRVIAGECELAGCADPLASLPGWCTMEGSAAFCGIRRGGGYKWPTLAELHQALFGCPYEGAHRALEDARACARCFFALVERGEG